MVGDELRRFRDTTFCAARRAISVRHEYERYAQHPHCSLKATLAAVLPHRRLNDSGRIATYLRA
jgi:hypothetical protein